MMEYVIYETRYDKDNSIISRDCIKTKDNVYKNVRLELLELALVYKRAYKGDIKHYGKNKVLIYNTKNQTNILLKICREYDI